MAAAEVEEHASLGPDVQSTEVLESVGKMLNIKWQFDYISICYF